MSAEEPKGWIGVIMGQSREEQGQSPITGGVRGGGDAGGSCPLPPLAWEVFFASGLR